MSKIIGIAAVSPEGIIAINGKMPWSCSEDLQYFKDCTSNEVVIMGRGTWDSLDRKCLPGRINYVVSNLGNFSLIANTSAIVFNNIENAIKEAQLRYPEKKIFIIGGASIYKQTMSIMDEFFLSIIHKKEVIYSEGERKYLEGYPNKLYDFFIEESRYIGIHATYEKYTRRINTKINPARFL